MPRTNAELLTEVDQAVDKLSNVTISAENLMEIVKIVAKCPTCSAALLKLSRDQPNA